MSEYKLTLNGAKHIGSTLVLFTFEECKDQVPLFTLMWRPLFVRVDECYYLLSGGRLIFSLLNKNTNITL